MHRSPASVALTALYVPGDRTDRVRKALGSGADIVIVDLEDAVSADNKHRARLGMHSALSDLAMGEQKVQVRVNPRGSIWHDADLAAVAHLPPHVEIRMPKVHAAEDVERAQELLPGRHWHALIESPLGVENAFAIAQAGVSSIGLGEADLCSALGLPPGLEANFGLAWARSRIVNAAAAAGIVPPLMSVFTNVRDSEGLRASCTKGRMLGFLGRAAIHPSQLAPIRESFAPSTEEVVRARETLTRVGEAAADSSGTVVLPDGSFLDAAMVEGAKRIVAINDSLTFRK
ncbi:CoA ester lyase [Leucobacter aridicollis]|nr:CoA ester lyase [Leucobacter aridicollis]MBL3682248.1 CoA ester lyase [Leucobacter aridicollis]